MEENRKQLTAEEVIRITIDLLAQISVPIALNQQIAVPISQAIGNLNIAEKTIRKELEAKKQDEPGIGEEEL